MKRFLSTTFLPFILALFIVISPFFLGTKTALAQTAKDAVPKPKVPCDATGDPEFNSLRPYQASPCGDQNYALFCGNKVTVVEEKTARRRGHWDSIPVDWNIDKEYWIDLSGTEFPILGNTELTQNSKNPQDKIDDATKVNEYVSWYLNGVNNRAEYGIDKNTNNEIVNLSGPIQKLLPQIIAEAQRIVSIASASATVASTPDEDNPGGATTEPATHNQIVVCASRQILGLIGKMVPRDCYDGNGSPAKAKVYRLKDWIGHLPPMPWDPKFAGDEKKYLKARCEWKGGAYITVPIINKSYCVDNPFNPNEYADLFPYVPLASTPDKLGKMPINTVTFTPSSGTVLDSHDWKKKAAPSLYYAHTQEAMDLSTTLNKTYVPSGLSTSDIPTDSTESNDAGSTPPCRVLKVRSNPGDNLFPIRTPADIGIWATFRVSSIGNCTYDFDKFGQEYSTCHGQVTIGIHTDPNRIPNANEIWKSTVAGNASTFRRIYPKVGAGAPVSCIADIPSVTNAVYTPVSGTDKIGVEGPLGSPDQTNMDPTNAQIYFSHFGSVYDYFLKGIQTALRPQGFADPSPESGTMCKSILPKECLQNVPDSEVPSKYLGAFKANFIGLANRWSATCPGPANNMATQCYNYVASTANKAGVNPAFALTIWLNESGASNYCASGATAQDFGINLPALYQNIVGQLAAFINMAKQKLCDGAPGFLEPMHGWLSRFQSSAGVCNPTDATATQYYFDVMNNTWNWVTGCPKNGKFGITWPTDMSCP